MKLSIFVFKMLIQSAHPDVSIFLTHFLKSPPPGAPNPPPPQAQTVGVHLMEMSLKGTEFNDIHYRRATGTWVAGEEGIL